MDKSERARLRALCEAATPGPECTEITARWCPRCGDCTCGPRFGGDPDGERTLCDDGCPLHAASSTHGEGEDDPMPRTAEGAALTDGDRRALDLVTCERDDARALLSEWRKLIVDTAAALGQTMPPCVWHDHGNIARLAADVVRERDEARGGRALAEELACAIGLERDLLRRERDEACAEAERLRAEVADHHAASVLPRETALRETAEALGFTHMGAQGFAGMAHRHRDAAVAAEREACAALCDAHGDTAERERDACCDDRSRSLHAGRMHGADECARAIRARSEGGAR